MLPNSSTKHQMTHFQVSWLTVKNNKISLEEKQRKTAKVKHIKQYPHLCVGFFFLSNLQIRIKTTKTSNWIRSSISVEVKPNHICNNVHTIMEHLTVTCIKPIRGFLQIYGHKKPSLLDQLDSEISAYQPLIKRIASMPELHPNLEFDTIYLALSIGQNKYHRCIVREKRPNNKAIIELIDYGNDFEVDTSLVSKHLKLDIFRSEKAKKK